MNTGKLQIPSPFDPENFRKEGYRVVDTLADYLNEALSGKEMPVLPWNDPDKLVEMFSFESGGGESEPLDSFLKRIIDQSIHIHHPHYIGHQVTSPYLLQSWPSYVPICLTMVQQFMKWGQLIWQWNEM